MIAAPRIKRAYNPAARADGKRVLIDRLWPRGLARAKAGIDLWLKEVAPSDALRREFGHDPARWHGFEIACRKELAANQAPVGQLLELCFKMHVHRQIIVEFGQAGAQGFPGRAGSGGRGPVMGEPIDLRQGHAVIVMLGPHRRDRAGDHRSAAPQHHREQDHLLALLMHPDFGAEFR